MTKVKIEIRSWFNGSVLFEYESENNTIRQTLEKAIETGADLTRANLTGADLTGADLTGANLTGADLTRADLTGANLTDADLTGANLTGADLTDADLTRAYLTGANLTGANLTDADLTRAYLTGANLTGANLTRAYLTGANLTGANLTDADLTDADLTGANLTGANLTGANLTDADLTGANLTRAYLTVIKNDFFIVLMHGIKEVKFLKQAIIDGKIDGSTYEGHGECSCLSGTLYTGAVKQDGPEESQRVSVIKSCRESSRPAERFFLGIKPGNTPENNQASKLALEWIEEFERLIA